MHVAHRRRLIGVLAATFVALSGVAATQASSTADATRHHPGHHHKHHQHHRKLMNIQLLSFNDFHGNLEPPSGSSGRIVVGHRIDPDTGKPVDVTQDVGGVEYLSTHLAQARRGHRNSLTVAAGDIVGASPLLSAAFHDEPTIEAMNNLGLDVTAVGNHEFDEGYKELQRMAAGGCIDDGPNGANNQNSCPDHTFAGAKFDYLAANVTYAGTDQTILPAYTIKKVHGARIGFIGMTLKDTPGIVTASGVAGLEFSDEVQTANKLVPVLRRKGVNAIVVLIHQGGLPDKQKWTDPATGTSYDVNPTYDYTCGKGGTLAATSPILPIAANLDPAIDLVVSGHTHQPYVCSVKGSNLQVGRDVTPDPAQSSLIDLYKKLVTPIASKVIGHISTDVTDDQNAAGESALGDLIADAQLADSSVVTGGQKPVIAFMNPGGIRTDLTATNSKYGEPTGDVTYEEAFNVQPFNNYLVSMSLTGQQIYDLLAQQRKNADGTPRTYVLQVSNGFTYQLGSAGAVDGTVKLNGTPIDKSSSYRIVTNNFLSDGGDGFPAFMGGTSKYFGGLDIDAFAAYLTAKSPYTPGPLTRITQ